MTDLKVPVRAVIREMKRDAVLKIIGTFVLPKRLPELMRARGWPTEDHDLIGCLMAAVACKAMGAGGQLFPRPPGAEQLGGLWPADAIFCTASQICDTLELDDLCKPR